MPGARSTSDSTTHHAGLLMSDEIDQSVEVQSQRESDDTATVNPDRRPAQRNNNSRQKRGGKGRSAYTFPDDLERCFCRNAYRVPPLSFPVTRREGAARPAMTELVRTETQVLFCDLLHEGPHVWPNGDEFDPV